MSKHKQKEHKMPLQEFLYYLRDPNRGDAERESFEERAKAGNCRGCVDNSGPAEGGGAEILEVDGQEFECPVGMGLVVVEIQSA